MSDYTTNLKTSDGLELFVQGWASLGDRAGVVCLLHGLGEHSGRYAHVAKALNQAGYEFLGVDLRGHGRSQGKRGHIPSSATLMDDIALLLEEAEARFPRSPLVLYGHSLGGGLALRYATQPTGASLLGLIATGPWLRLAFEPPAYKIALGRVMDRIWPAFVQPNGIDTHALSRDPEVVRRYQEDPLVHDRISARLFAAAYQNGLNLLDRAARLRHPLLLMHGGEDRLTSAQASREFADAAGAGCTFKVWDGLFHEIHNEPEQDRVFSFMIAWLDQHVRKPS
jgi:alpha-beta hydrolase superfamily lysophospholipase